MTMRLFPSLRALAQDIAGSAVIETALVAPALLLMALGGYQVSMMVTRQTELQGAAGVAATIIRASPPSTQSDLNTIRNVIAQQTGLNNNQIGVVEIYRCDTDSNYVTDYSLCGSNPYSSFIQVTLTDTYQPVWTNFGVGSNLSYDVVRTIQISTTA